MLLKCCTQYVSKFGKLSSGHRTGKCQFSFQSQRRAVPKNVQIIMQLCSFHMLGGASLIAQLVKNPSAMQETWVWSLDWKIPWRRAWQPTPVLSGESPWTEEPGGLQLMGSQRVRHDWATRHKHIPSLVMYSVWLTYFWNLCKANSRCSI